MGRRNPLFFQIVFFLLLAVGCRQKNNKGVTAAETGPVEQPEFVMSPFRIQAFGGPGLEWELRSPMARAFTSMNVMRAEQVDLTLYDQGEKSTTIQSDRGVFCIQNGQLAAASPKPGESVRVIEEQGTTLRTGDMLLSGNVVVISTDGTKLLTNWLHYQKEHEVIRSTAPVQIIRADSITNGIGLEATPDLQRVKIFNQTLVIKGDDEKK